MDTPRLATDRLLEAQRLIQSVMDGLDISIIDCPCPEHARHYANWSDAQTHIRLQGIVDRLNREAHNDSVTDLTARERKEHGYLVTARAALAAAHVREGLATMHAEEDHGRRTE